MSVGLGHIGASLNDLTAPSSQRVQSKELGQDDFLKIMIEQLRSQNPLEPQDNSEFFSQMVQFQSLDAMQTMTNAIRYLAEVSELAQASALVGRDVTALIEAPANPETGVPGAMEEVTGTVVKVTFAERGAVLHLEDGLHIPISKIVAVS
jgi:flagellar basal-body rod modification protein FlgD